MLAGFLTVIPQSRSTVLLTYRPEYHGALANVTGAQAIALRPLSSKHTSALVHELLRSHPSVSGLAEHIAERAAGNPFFAEEMVRDLAERDVIDGKPGEYILRGEIAEVSVPATLQTTIAARIDRLAPAAKQTLSAAAVIGSRFEPELLQELGIDPALHELVAAELVDQVKFTRGEQFAFRRPLVRTVAYESQLKSVRAQLHRHLASLVEQQQSTDENAALIAEHLEAAGDLHDAFGWHMRAGTWLTIRDITAARLSWERAREIADRLPADDPDRLSMRIAPRTLLCLSAWRAGGTIEQAGFDELRALTSAAGDKTSLAIGMAGQVSSLFVHARIPQASRLASEYASLVESIGDPTLTLALLYAAIAAKCSAAEIAELMRLSQRVIDLADNDPTKGNLIVGSPLAVGFTLRAIARACLGDPEWKEDFARGGEITHALDPTTQALIAVYKYGCIISGMLRPDQAAMDETAAVLITAERSGDNTALFSAQFIRGVVVVHSGGTGRDEGLRLLVKAREAAVEEQYSLLIVPLVDLYLAMEKARVGELDDAIELARKVVETEFDTGDMAFVGPTACGLADLLLRRGAAEDVREVEMMIERLEALPIEHSVLFDVHMLRLRAMLARARGDEVSYRDSVERYRNMAESLGFEGHIAIAKAM